MIEARDLAWGDPGHDDGTLTATVAQGACVALLGPLPAITALFDVVGGRRAPRSGRLLVGGRGMTTRPSARRALFFGAHRMPLPGDASTGEILALACAGRRGTALEVAEVLAVAGLAAVTPVRDLDSAAQDTLRLAAAVGSGARGLLLASPFAGGTHLDHKRRRALLSEARHQGRTLLLTGLSPRDPLADSTLEVGR